MIAMVPSVLPEGWSVSGAGYSPSQQWWRIELTAPSGDVVLDQLGGTLNQRLKPHLTDLTEAEDVDLSKWGIETSVSSGTTVTEACWRVRSRAASSSCRQPTSRR